MSYDVYLKMAGCQHCGGRGAEAPDLMTCACCELKWSSPLLLRQHLLTILRAVADKLAELDRAKL